MGVLVALGQQSMPRKSFRVSSFLFMVLLLSALAPVVLCGYKTGSCLVTMSGVRRILGLTSVVLGKRCFLILITTAIVCLSNQIGYSSVTDCSRPLLTTELTDSRPGSKPGGENPRGLGLKLVTAIRRADYEDDRAGLNRLFKELESFVNIDCNHEYQEYPYGQKIGGSTKSLESFWRGPLCKHRPRT